MHQNDPVRFVLRYGCRRERLQRMFFGVQRDIRIGHDVVRKAYLRQTQQQFVDGQIGDFFEILDAGICNRADSCINHGSGDICRFAAQLIDADRLYPVLAT